MKNEKKLLLLPWASDMPIISAEEKAEKNDYRWKGSSLAPEKPLLFYAELQEVEKDTYLVITFYNGRQLQYRMFFLQREYLGQFAENEKASKATLSYLEDWKCFKGWYKGSIKSAEIICKYLAIPYTSAPIQAICKLINDQKALKIKKMHDKIRQTDDDVLLQVKDIPKDFEKWILDGPLKNSKYIFYNYAKRKNMDGICSECHQDVIVTNPRNDKKGVCPNCKAKVIYKARRNGLRIIDETYVALVQKIKDGYVIRYFHVKKYYHDCVETEQGHWFDKRGSYRYPILDLFESAREFNDFDHKFFLWGNFKNTGEYRFCRDYDHSAGSYYLYGRNCKKVFSEESGIRKYFPFADFAQHAPRIKVADFLVNIIRIPQLEFLAKCKLYRITAEIGSGNAYGDTVDRIKNSKKIHEALQIQKDWLPAVQKADMSLDEVRTYRCLRIFGEKQVQAAKKWIEEQPENRWHQGVFEQITQYTTPMKAIKYLDKQKEILSPLNMLRAHGVIRYASVWDINREWMDYLNSSQKLGDDIKNEFVLFPDHLPEAHDEATRRLLEKERKIENEQLKGIAHNAKSLNAKYGFHTDAFLIRAPKNYTDLLREGQNLGHCVGTYARRVANGLTTILFIRKMEDPTTSFYTLEYRDNRVLQCRGKSNCSMTPEVEKFVDKWKKKVEANQKKQQDIEQFAAVAG